MSEIMPISREAIENELAEENKENVKIEINDKKDAVEVEEEEEEAEAEEVKEKFIKPKEEKPVEISKRTGKPKRKLTAVQLENLKKARERSVARRKELKEGKDIVKKAAKIKKQQEREVKLQKKMESEEIIELKAKLHLEAQESAVWTEDKLQNLIDKSIDNYITKRKAQKPLPRATIPAPQMPNAIGHQPLDPKYYMPQNSQNYYNQAYNPQVVQQPQIIQDKNQTLSGLFGNYQ